MNSLPPLAISNMLHIFALDNVAGYELVLPNGSIKYVTQKDKDLWFGLRVSRKGSIQVGDANFEMDFNRREGSIISYAPSFES